jgi:hypothetical protein
MSKGLEIPHEIADGIVLASLQDHLEYMKKELKKCAKGEYLHPEDAHEYQYVLIPAFEKIIKYYGG